MSKLDQYILRNFFVAVSFFLFALVGIFWLGQSVALIDQIVLRGESTETFLELSTNLLPNIFVNVTPIAVLAAVLAVLSQMASHGELFVLDASGRNPIRMIYPIMIIGLLSSLFLYALTTNLAPRANHELRVSLDEIEANFSKNIVPAGQFVFPIKGVTIFANNSVLSGEMLQVFIEDRREPLQIRAYFAQKGILQRNGNLVQIALINGQYHDSDLKSGTVSRTYFEKTTVNLDNFKPLETDKSHHLNELYMNDLVANVQEINSPVFPRYVGELTHRLAFPTLGFVLPILSALLFLMAPFSRHGYTMTIAWIAFLGLIMDGIMMGLQSFVEAKPNFYWLGFAPLLILIIVLIVALQRKL